MEHLLLQLSDWFGRVPERAARYRWPIILVVIVTTAVMVVGVASRFSMDTAAHSFLDPDDPAIVALDKFRRQFGSDDSVLLAYRAKDGDVFSAASLQAVQSLTRDLEAWQTLSIDQGSDKPGATVDLDELKHIRRVQSLTTLRVEKADADTLLSMRLVPGDIPQDRQALSELRKSAMAQSDYRGTFYSPEGDVALVLVKTDFGALPDETYVPAIDADGVSLDEALERAMGDDENGVSYDDGIAVQEVRYKRPDNAAYARFFNALQAVYTRYDDTLEFYPVGYAPLTAFVQQVLQQSALLNIGMLLIVAVLLWRLFRSLSAVVWPVIAIVLSLVWTVGIAAWSATTLSSMITLTVMLVFAVGIADCVHVLSAYLSERRRGSEHMQALSQAYRNTGLAILVTTVTTAAGIGALSFSELVPIRIFSAVSALGVGLAFMFTVILLPVLLTWWHPKKVARTPTGGRLPAGRARLGAPLKALSVFFIALAVAYVGGYALSAYIIAVSLLAYFVIHRHQQVLAALPSIVFAHRNGILLLFAGVLFVCGYGATQVRIDSNIVELIREGSAVRTAYQEVDKHLSGTQTLSIMIDSHTADGVLDPRILKRIDVLQSAIEERYPQAVGRTYSLANVVKDTHQLLRDDNPEFWCIPDSRTLIAQLLYLFNGANPEDRRSIVSDDYAQTHIAVTVHNAGSSQYAAFFQDIGQEIDLALSPVRADFPDLEVTLTGSIALIMRNADAIANAQYRGFVVALGVISVIMIVTLGSLQAGLLSVIPNLLPALLAFGLMGLLDIPLDTDTLLIAPVIIGIAVDDTVHFMTHYRLALMQTRDAMRALESTVREVGQAVLFTSLVLGLGFAILGFSDYLGTAKIGIFGALAILMALLCDLFLLPALVALFKPNFGMREAIDSRTIARQGL